MRFVDRFGFYRKYGGNIRIAAVGCFWEMVVNDVG